MFENYPDLMSVIQVKEALCISKNTVYQLLHDRKIAYFQCAGKYRIIKQGLISYISERSVITNE